MDNFTFANPTRIVFGVGSMAQVGKETAALGATALLVSGRGHAEKSGLLARVEKLLADAGVRVLHLKGVEPNPRISLVKEGVALAKAHAVQVVVALGGGSVMDTAKAVAAGVFYQGDLWDMTKHGQSPYVAPQRSLPTVMLPTLAATGSEMNTNAVITNRDRGEKCAISSPACYPKLSILDPALTCSMPPKQTAYGAVDTIAHVIEAYLNSVDDTPLQDRIQEGVMCTVIEEAPKALADPNDLSARGNLQWASVVALNGLPQAGCSAPYPMHWIEHAVSARYDVAHGAGLAILIPAWMKVACPSRPGRYVQFARRIFDVEVKGRHADEVAAEGIERLEAFFRSIGAPTHLKDVAIGPDKFDLMARDVIRISGLGTDRIGGRPPLDAAGIRKVLETAQ